MKIINNIKYQYHYKVLTDLISSNEFTKFFNTLRTKIDNKEIFLRLLSDLGLPFIQKNNIEIFKNKIIWVNSFLKSDTDYISNFLDYYLSKLNEPLLVKDYPSAIIDELKKYENTQKLTLSDFLNFSYLYQFLILNNNNLCNIIKNELPFFSQNNNLNFSKNNLTQCYLYVVDHPFNVYEQIKLMNGNDHEIAKNIFLNLDAHVAHQTVKDVEVEVLKKGWDIHVNSWIDTNVINTLNGKIIIKKDLINDPFDVLSSLILHIIQSGVKVKIDYEIIEKFVNDNPIKSFDSAKNLSQKEKKFINQYVGKITDTINFD